jgi:hypothetical protein
VWVHDTRARNPSNDASAGLYTNCGFCDLFPNAEPRAQIFMWHVSGKGDAVVLLQPVLVPAQAAAQPLHLPQLKPLPLPQHHRQSSKPLSN